MFYKTSAVKQAIINETEAPFQGMKTTVLEDGSTWGRIYWLDIHKDKTCFGNEVEAKKSVGPNRFSMMKYLDKFGSSLVDITNLAPEINGGTGFSQHRTYDSSIHQNLEGWHKYSGTSLFLTQDMSSNTETTSQTTTASIPIVQGNKYYIRYEIKQETVVGNTECFLGGDTVGGSVTASGHCFSGSASAAKTWTPISGVVTRNIPTGNHRFRFDFNHNKTAGHMHFDGLVIVDLTKHFGAGKEPSKAWCDNNIPYFRDTITVNAVSENYRKWEFMLRFPLLNETLTELDYIQSTGTQYINTGYKPTSEKLKIHIDFKQDTSASSQSLFGSEDNKTSSSRQWSIVSHGGAGSYAHYLGNTSGYLSHSLPINQIHDYTVEANNGNFSVELNGKIQTGTYSGALLKTYDILIFANNIDGTPGQFAKNKLYSFKIWDNDVLVRDMIPCKKEDGTVGMFDKISQKFYANAGSGTFTAGNEKNKFIFAPCNRWSQLDHPDDVTTPSGYTRIQTSWTTKAGPLRRYVSANRIWDCDNGNNSNWFNPIGQLAPWSDGNGSIPGADGKPQYEIELWVRVDRLNPATQAQIYEGEIIAKQFYEI